MASHDGSRRPWMRRLMRWVLVWIGFQGVLVITGRVLARRLDQGDEKSPVIRRVLALGGFDLRPASPALSRIDLDLGMGGVDLDLTGVGRPPGGVDLNVRCLMGGVAVRVPADWRVWWSYAGLGGIGSDGGMPRTQDPRQADLRVHARVMMGGVGVETAA